ncbi:MAG: FAD-dependent oxidoreductase [Candidatus Eisenbacteria bacterium]|nr:FAD-dependent oxidoreductase [Candidatus Eisenbacteria bacterium]
MKAAEVVIIGGSAAGPVAGITAKRHYGDIDVLLIRKEGKAKVMVPCGIPYIFGTVGSPDKNVIPDGLLSNNGIDLMIDEVTKIDRRAKTLKTASGETVSYGKLILATGSEPVRPPIPGMDLENVFPVWKDADYLADARAVLEKAKNVVIIGGGFIGAEMADECRKMGDASVTIVEMLPHCLMLAMDTEFCAKAEEKLKERGIRIVVDNGVKTIRGSGKVESVELQNGDELKADAVIIGIGAAPNTALARDAGLEIGETKGIRVDEYMRTGDEDIFAVGDCAEKWSFFTGKPSGLRLASIATTEARIAGANVRELKRENPGAIGVFATAFDNLAVAASGLTEKAAAAAGFDVVVATAASMDRHPGCMPSAVEMKIKLVFDKKSRKLLGGEVCGGASTAEMANVIAMAIQNGMTAEEIALFQMGTHPALTASPIAYQLVNAAEIALATMKK